MRTEDLINKCIQGGAPKDVLDELEGELPTIQEIKNQVIRDMRSAQIKLPSDAVKVTEDNVVQIDCSKVVQEWFEIDAVISTYEPVYPELKFVKLHENSEES